MATFIDAKGIMAMLPRPNVQPTPSPTPTPPTPSPTPSVIITTAPTQPPMITLPPPIAPPPEQPAPSPAMPPFTQQPINIDINIPDFSRPGAQNPAPHRDHPPQYPYPVPPYYGAGVPLLAGGGLPGLGGAIGSYPGVAGDASIKIGNISNSVSQGNTNIGDGTQNMPNFPGAEASRSPEMLITAGPVQMEAPPMLMEMAPPAPVSSGGPNWPLMIAVLCMLVALGVAGYLLWKRFSSSTASSNNKKVNNRGAGAGNANRGAAAGAAAANAANANLPNANNTFNGAGDDFGDFGDFDAPPAGAATTRR